MLSKSQYTIYRKINKYCAYGKLEVTISNRGNFFRNRGNRQKHYSK